MGKVYEGIAPRVGGEAAGVLGERRVAYFDLTGSGAETIAHVRENGRVVIMFCAFSGPPKIVRSHGKGRIVTPRDPAWGEMRRHFPDHVGARALVDIDMWTRKKGLVAYRRQKNARSIDGLPVLELHDEG